VKRKATIQPVATKNTMADGSNKEETGSQQIRAIDKKQGIQRILQERCRPYRGNRNHKNSLQRNLAELSNNVYQYGTRDQGDRFTRTAEAIADYVGREYSKEM
jgi:hypothetical protein